MDLDIFSVFDKQRRDDLEQFFYADNKEKMVVWPVSGRLVCDNSGYVNFAQDVDPATALVFSQRITSPYLLHGKYSRVCWNTSKKGSGCLNLAGVRRLLKEMNKTRNRAKKNNERGLLV